jgi:hypothetical protein
MNMPKTMNRISYLPDICGAEIVIIQLPLVMLCRRQQNRHDADQSRRHVIPTIDLYNLVYGLSTNYCRVAERTLCVNGPTLPEAHFDAEGMTELASASTPPPALKISACPA